MTLLVIFTKSKWLVIQSLSTSEQMYNLQPTTNNMLLSLLLLCVLLIQIKSIKFKTFEWMLNFRGGTRIQIVFNIFRYTFTIQVVRAGRLLHATSLLHRVQCHKIWVFCFLFHTVPVVECIQINVAIKMCMVLTVSKHEGKPIEAFLFPSFSEFIESSTRKNPQ